jgi:hypothetical protein
MVRRIGQRWKLLERWLVAGKSRKTSSIQKEKLRPNSYIDEIKLSTITNGVTFFRMRFVLIVCSVNKRQRGTSVSLRISVITAS